MMQWSIKRVLYVSLTLSTHVYVGLGTLAISNTRLQ